MVNHSLKIAAIPASGQPGFTVDEEKQSCTVSRWQRDSGVGRQRVELMEICEKASPVLRPLVCDYAFAVEITRAVTSS